MENNFKSGFIGVLGLPNVGKSTLTNALVGEKVSIVSEKPQTTRQRITGITTQTDAQYIFVDAPGLTDRPGEMNEFLRDEWQNVAESCDAIMVVLDLSQKLTSEVENLLAVIEKAGKPFVVIGNKKDLLSASELDELSQRWQFPFTAVSALAKSEDLRVQVLPRLREILPTSPALYGDEIYTTQNIRELVREIIREKCFALLHQEIPYGLGVRISKFDESDAKIVKIYAEILVSKENHKPMVIGRGGVNLKTIGSKARSEIEKIVDRKVFLQLHVQTRVQWTKNKMLMKELGYGGNQ